MVCRLHHCACNHALRLFSLSLSLSLSLSGGKSKPSSFIAIRCLRRHFPPHSGAVFLVAVLLNSQLHNAMVLDGVINSPHRRSQTAFASASLKKQHTKGDELGSFWTVVRRHRFLLTALAVLAFLCTIYLYFAVTLGEDNTCSGLTGTQKALCHSQLVKQSVGKGKMKFL